jgi:hypothetical protein
VRADAWWAAPHVRRDCTGNLGNFGSTHKVP